MSMKNSVPLKPPKRNVENIHLQTKHPKTNKKNVRNCKRKYRESHLKKNKWK